MVDCAVVQRVTVGPITLLEHPLQRVPMAVARVEQLWRGRLECRWQQLPQCLQLHLRQNAGRLQVLLQRAPQALMINANRESAQQKRASKLLFKGGIIRTTI